MKSLGRICVIGSLLLVATASAFGVANPADIDRSDSDAAQAAGQQPPPAQEPSVAQPGQPAGGNPLWGISIKQLSATRERPIFSPSRRAPVVEAPVAAVASPPVQAPRPPERPQLSLVGTIVGGADGFAIFVDQTTNAPLRVRMGADYQGWMLRQVEARSVTLQKGQDVAVLSLAKPAGNASVPGAGFAQTRSDVPPPAPTPASTVPARPPYLSPESNAIRMSVRPRRHH